MSRVITVMGLPMKGRKLGAVLLLGSYPFRMPSARLFYSVQRKPLPAIGDVKTIYVSKPDHLGDILMVVPALRSLRVTYPESRILLGVGKWGSGLADFLVEGGFADEKIMSESIFS